MFPYQLVCEGKADEVFFSRLLQFSGKNVDVRCPKKDDPNGALGRDSIYRTLNGLQAQFDKISRVVVLVDSDDDPEQAITDAREQFRKANDKNPAKPYPIPLSANTVATGAGAPDTAIALVPAAQSKGCLDTLLLPSFEQRFPARLNCVEDFCTCMNDLDIGVTKESTMRLRVLIASAYPRRPGTSLANILEEGHCPIDLAHNSFDAIRGVLLGLFP